MSMQATPLRHSGMLRSSTPLHMLPAGAQHAARPRVARPERVRSVRVMAASWGLRLDSTAPLLGDTSTNLRITVHDAASNKRSPAHTVAKVQGTQLSLIPAKPTGGAQPGMQGWVRTERMEVPDDIKAVGAITIEKVSPDGTGDELVDYIEQVTLSGPTAGDVVVPVHSWVSSSNGARTFFAPAAYLPTATPPALQQLRANELAALRAEPATNDSLPASGRARRADSDRKYGYQVYDDLGTDRLLGNTPKYPYPRRLATEVAGSASGPAQTDQAKRPNWLPYDEQFEFSKKVGFNGGGLFAAVMSVAASARTGNTFDSFKEILGLYAEGAKRAMFAPLAALRNATTLTADLVELLLIDLPPALRASARGVGAASASGANPALALVATLSPILVKLLDLMDQATGTIPFARGVQRALGMVVTMLVQAIKALRPATPLQPSIGDVLEYTLAQLRSQAGLAIRYPVPSSIEGRPEAWLDDAEMGRQALAGVHPVTITALRKTPEELGSAIRDEHVTGDLGGKTLQQLVDAHVKDGEKPRLFWVDYWVFADIWDDMPPGTRVQHAGRCLYYLQPSGNALVPVAIELAHNQGYKPGSGAPTFGQVYSRSKLNADPKTRVVWQLAKEVFRSLDSGYHQFVSHWLRTHAVMEPFLISLRRNLSAMHPVHKLMLPHFRYTLNINANARSSLINQDTVIEQNFSAGPMSMRLSSVVYKKVWRFAKQALPADLEDRGMLKPGPAASLGKPETRQAWLQYPYAEDGLDLWNWYMSYFGEYLEHYYKSDATVLGDAELQQWWEEVKTLGHGDLLKWNPRTGAEVTSAAEREALEKEVWGFSGPIRTVGALTHVLGTIAYIASAHHAAVNFGQYDFSGFMPNFPSLIAKPMPKPGEPEFAALTKKDLSSEDQQKLFLTWLTPTENALKVMTVMHLLSGHARDEQTLDMPNEYLQDPDIKKLDAAHRQKLAKLEKTFEQRNRDVSTNWARKQPYELLMPSSGPGVTGRGVPYSVSI